MSDHDKTPIPGDDDVEELDTSAIVVDGDDFEAAIPTVVELRRVCPDCETTEDHK